METATPTNAIGICLTNRSERIESIIVPSPTTSNKLARRCHLKPSEFSAEIDHNSKLKQRHTARSR